MECKLSCISQLLLVLCEIWQKVTEVVIKSFNFPHETTNANNDSHNRIMMRLNCASEFLVIVPTIHTHNKFHIYVEVKVRARMMIALHDKQCTYLILLIVECLILL